MIVSLQEREESCWGASIENESGKGWEVCFVD